MFHFQREVGFLWFTEGLVEFLDKAFNFRFVPVKSVVLNVRDIIVLQFEVFVALKEMVLSLEQPYIYGHISVLVILVEKFLVLQAINVLFLFN